MTDDIIIFEGLYAGGMGRPRTTRWSVTDLDSGVTYKNGEACARALGVTGGAVNNCLGGRQKTCGGHRLVRTYVFKREMLTAVRDICDQNGTEFGSVMEEFGTLCGHF